MKVNYKFECHNCRVVNVIYSHDEGLTGFMATGLINSDAGYLTWCRVCGVVQKLSVVAPGGAVSDDATNLTKSTTPHAQHQCPACEEKRLHSDEEWREFHPPANTDIDNIGTRRVNAGGDVPSSDQRIESSSGDV